MARAEHTSVPNIIFGIGNVLFVLLPLRGITYPPHSCRRRPESDTAAIILNCYQEGFSLFHPRINQCGDGSGSSGGQLPISQHLPALGSNASGLFTLFHS